MTPLPHSPAFRLADGLTVPAGGLSAREATAAELLMFQDGERFAPYLIAETVQATIDGVTQRLSASALSVLPVDQLQAIYDAAEPVLLGDRRVDLYDITGDDVAINVPT